MANNRLESLKKGIASDRARIQEISQKKFNDENFDMLASARKLKFTYQQFETIRRSENFTPAVEIVLSEVSESFKLLDFDDLDIGQIDAFIESLQAVKIMAKAAIENKGTRAKIEKIVNNMQNEAASISAGTILKERLTSAAKNYVSKMFDFTGIVSFVSRGNPLLTSMARMVQESYGSSKQRKRVSASAQAQAQIRKLNAGKQVKQKLVSRGGIKGGNSGAIRIGGLSNSAGGGGTNLFDGFSAGGSGGMGGGDDIGSGGILSRILEEHISTNDKLDNILRGMQISEDRATEDSQEAYARRKRSFQVSSGNQQSLISEDDSGLDEFNGSAAGAMVGSLLGGRGLKKLVSGIARFAVMRAVPVLLAYQGLKAVKDLNPEKLGKIAEEGVEAFYRAFGLNEDDVQKIGMSASSGAQALINLLQVVGRFATLDNSQGEMTVLGDKWDEWKKNNIIREKSFDTNNAPLGAFTANWEGNKTGAMVKDTNDAFSFGKYQFNEKGVMPKFVNWLKDKGINLDLSGSEAQKKRAWANFVSTYDPEGLLQDEFYQNKLSPEYRNNAIKVLGEGSRGRLEGDRGLGDFIDDIYHQHKPETANQIIREGLGKRDLVRESERDLVYSLSNARRERLVRLGDEAREKGKTGPDNAYNLSRAGYPGANLALRVDKNTVQRDREWMLMSLHAADYSQGGSPPKTSTPTPVITPPMTPQPAMMPMSVSGGGGKLTSWEAVTFGGQYWNGFPN